MTVPYCARSSRTVPTAEIAPSRTATSPSTIVIRSSMVKMVALRMRADGTVQRCRRGLRGRTRRVEAPHRQRCRIHTATNRNQFGKDADGDFGGRHRADIEADRCVNAFETL